ncbi:putative transport protein [[Actinomadura] parvosata subsp. kistnae]|nr:putative transport protein [Actinomadura parvosata subsp. kistnae]
MLDTLLGLLVVVSLPLAVVAIPNTLSVVARLLPPGLDQAGLMRTHGLALPALMLAVPLAAVALRRVPAAHLLVAGLALVALTDAAGGFAGSELVVGVVRVLRGVGSGLVLTTTLAAVWQRVPVLRALWVGVFGLGLLTAQALALWPLDEVSSWRVTLQPYPLLTGVALGLAALHLVAWMLLGRPETPVPDLLERGRLLVAAVPAAVVAAVAISTASEGWRALPVILLASLAVLGLLVLASTGDAGGRLPAYTMVAVGVVLLPSAAQVTLVEMGGLGGPGLRGLWVPYVVAGLLAVVASVAVRLLTRTTGRWLAPMGLLAMVVGLCSVRLVVPSADGLVLAVPFSLLAVGAAVALTAASQEAGVGTAMFGLSLGCTGVLVGFLLGTGVQMAMLDGVRSAQELVDSFVGALHWWALIGGFLVVAIIVLAAVMARRSGSGAVPVEPVPSSEPPCAGIPTMPPADVLLVPAPGRDDDDEEEGPTGAIPRVVVPVSTRGAFDQVAAAPGDGPAVPPQGQSPEDGAAS